MEKLQDYLNNEYLNEKDQHKSVEDLIEKVIPMYNYFDSDTCWPYELGCEQNSLSTSTTSMLAFSMAVLMGNKIDLVVGDEGKNYFNNFFSQAENVNYKKRLKKALGIIEEKFKNNKNSFLSNTYGKNDPFTIMWVRYLVDNISESMLGYREFDELCEKKVYDILCLNYEDKETLEFSDGFTNDDNHFIQPPIEKTHMFPLLKIIQLYSTLEKNKIKNKMVANTENEKRGLEEKHIHAARETLKNSLHYYLSLTNIENSNFDAAELVFSLEGFLLLDENKDNFDQNLLDRVFQVIKERQEISLYWRPLKPFVSNQQGLALLPLSVEIAMSLIRICRLLGKKGDKLFSENYEIFEKYTEWLKTRVTVVSCKANNSASCNLNKEETCGQNIVCDENKFYGWCSEHIYRPNVIHLWETSQVLVYLANFNDMLQKHIAYKSLKYSTLTIDPVDIVEDVWKTWEKGEPVDKEGFNMYKQIGESYINREKNKNYSMLLYGPPGTGKSSIAEKIAEEKKWPLITITPSDFIANGVDQVENKTKNIFTVLGEQKDVVVLFDEIDRLILDRDSDYYSEQSDLFQFMTPSMLVKIKNLREKKKVIFIICTNYEERIDLAIKRAGRIDEKYLVLPPDKLRREKLFNEFADKNIKSKLINKSDIVKKTALYTYTEFKQLLKKIEEKLAEPDCRTKIELAELINAPSITLMSYNEKIGIQVGEKKEKNTQKPIREFLALLFLKMEVNDEEDFNHSEKTVVNNYLLAEFTKDKKMNLYEIIKNELKNDDMVYTILLGMVKLISREFLGDEFDQIDQKVNDAIRINKGN